LFSEEHALWAISPFDGRYRRELEPIARIFSEAGFMNHRYQVEVAYLKAFCKSIDFAAGEPLEHLPSELSTQDLLRIKELEAVTHHDVAALVRFIQEQLPEEWRRWVHFGLTSEDVNNLALGRMLLQGQELLLGAIRDVVRELLKLAQEHAKTLMLGRTHGEAATPTTLGKELAVYAVRLAKAGLDFQRVQLEGKLLGATGALNALVATISKFDWLAFSEDFVKSQGLTPNLLATQVLPGDTYALYLDALGRVLGVVEDLDQNIWLYSLQGYLRHRVSQESVGSSTMPHKINPILFENSEGNAQAARALARFLADKLQKSRLQRDLSDSTVKRRLGEVLAGAWLALKNTTKGIYRLQVDKKRIAADLEANGQIFSELWQLEARWRGKEKGYEEAKAAFRGKSLTISEARKALRRADISETEVKSFLYGYAPDLVQKAVKECATFLGKSTRP